MEDKTRDLCAAAFDRLSVGAMVLRRHGEKDYVVCALNEAAFRMGNWKTLRPEHVVGRTLTELFDNVEASGLLTQYVEVLDSGQPRSLGRVPYGDSEVPDSVFAIEAHPLDASHLLLTYANVTEEERGRTELEQRAEQLAQVNGDLQRFNKLVVGRELRMIELKKQVNELCVELGREQPYKEADAA